MNIVNINLSRLANSEHLALMWKLIAILKRYINMLPELQKVFAKLTSLLEVESQTLSMLESSTFTALKSKADDQRDNAARHLLYYVRSFEYSDDPVLIEAAHLLDEILRKIPAIVKEGIARKTIDLNSLTAQLAEDPFTAAVQALNAEKLALKITEKNSAFDTISQQQSETDSAKGSGNMSIVRKPVDDEIHRVFRMIENRFDSETADDAVKTCVNEINYAIRETVTSWKQRMGRGKKDDDSSVDDDSIEDDGDGNMNESNE